MTRRLARIYTILNAIIQVYDVPGAPLYEAPFEISQLRQLIPYLYCTKQVAIFTLTQTSDIYLHPTRSTVLHAVFRMIQFPYKKGRTIEQYFKMPGFNFNLFKTLSEKDGETSKVIVDPNYVQLPGKYKDVVLKGVSEHSIPRLGVNEVGAEFDGMTQLFISVQKVKPIALSALNDSDMAQVFSLPREREMKKIPVLVRDFQADVVYIAVDALNHFHDDLLLDALETCIHDSFKPQEILLGMVVQKARPKPQRPSDMNNNNNDPDVPLVNDPLNVEKEGEEEMLHQYNHIYRTLSITPDLIDSISVGPKLTSGDVTYLPPTVAKMFGGLNLHPDKQCNGETYAANRVKRTKAVREIEEDLDDWAHELHHYRSACPGLPEHSPAKQMAIFNRMRSFLLANEKLHEQNNLLTVTERKKIKHEPAMMLKYPHILVFAEDQRILASEASRRYGAMQKFFEKRYEEELRQWNGLSNSEKRRVPRPVKSRLASTGDGMQTYKSFVNLLETSSDATRLLGDASNHPPSVILNASTGTRGLTISQEHIQMNYNMIYHQENTRSALEEAKKLLDKRKRRFEENEQRLARRGETLLADQNEEDAAPMEIVPFDFEGALSVPTSSSPSLISSNNNNNNEVVVLQKRKKKKKRKNVPEPSHARSLLDESISNSAFFTTN